MTDKTTIIKNLAEMLARLDSISCYDKPGHSEAWAMAISFEHLADSFAVFTNKLLPQLHKASDSEEINGILLEIADEFRHILFHIHAMKFYESLRIPLD